MLRKPVHERLTFENVGHVRSDWVKHVSPVLWRVKQTTTLQIHHRAVNYSKYTKVFRLRKF